MAAFYTLTRGAAFPRAATIHTPRATARHRAHRTTLATAIRGAIGQLLACVWSLLALGSLLLVLAGFFAR